MVVTIMSIFSEIEVGSVFWYEIGTEWFAARKIDSRYARYETPDGLKYGEPYAPAPDLKVKVVE